MRIADATDFDTFLSKWGVTISDATFKARVQEFLVGSDTLYVNTATAETIKMVISYGDGEQRYLQFLTVVYTVGSEALTLSCSIPMTATNVTTVNELIANAFSFYIM